MLFRVWLLGTAAFKGRGTAVVLLPWECSRCCECFALLSSPLELWGARGLGTARLRVLGPEAVWKG